MGHRKRRVIARRIGSKRVPREAYERVDTYDLHYIVHEILILLQINIWIVKHASWEVVRLAYAWKSG